MFDFSLHLFAKLSAASVIAVQAAALPIIHEKTSEVVSAHADIVREHTFGRICPRVGSALLLRSMTYNPSGSLATN